MTPPNSSAWAAASAVGSAGEDPRLEPVVGSVRTRVGVLERVDRVDDADGPEDLVADDPRRLGGLGEHDRAERVGVGGAGEELRARGLGLLDPLGDPRARVGVDHRPHVGRLVRRVADGQRLDLRQEALEEAVEGGLLDIDPLDGDAAWPAKEKAFAASFVAARSRSASAATTTGVELPSSSRTRFFAARSAMPQPTPLEPVNVIILHALVLHEHVADLAGRARRGR